MRLNTQHHSSTVLLTGGLDNILLASRPRVRDRLVVRLRTRRLDRALARGTSPETSAALALRAQHLTEPEQRGSIARDLRRIIREPQAPRRPALSRLMPSRPRVRAAREELIRLADTLEEPG